MTITQCLLTNVVGIISVTVIANYVNLLFLPNKFYFLFFNLRQSWSLDRQKVAKKFVKNPKFIFFAFFIKTIYFDPIFSELY